jgi:hypothetical protein
MSGRAADRERGSAVVDFVLVLLVVLPVFLGILQVALTMHVRNTLASAASEGARYAATADRGPADGAARAREHVRGAISARYARRVSAREVLVGGAPGVAVRIEATVPALGLGGPGLSFTVVGRAVEEAP